MKQVSVLLTVGPKCTLAASHAAPGIVTVSMSTGQTDRRTDARPLHYAFRYGRGQHNNSGLHLIVERVVYPFLKEADGVNALLKY